MTSAENPTFELVKQLGQDLAQNDFDLPPFPDTALQIQEALNDPDVSIPELGTIVLSEPSLAARVLRMANSAMLRRGPMEITDINAAIARIGLDMVHNATVSFAAGEVFQAPEGSASLEKLKRAREHSIKVSALAYVLAHKVKFVGKPDEAMLAGLLCAVGKFYILLRAGEFPELCADEETLDQLLGQWHSGVGRAIVESWGFPEEIPQAIDEYEVIERERFLTADLTDLVLVANLLARADGEDISELADIASLSRMKIDVEGLRNFLQESEEEIRTLTQALSG